MFPILPFLPVIGSALGRVFGGASEGRATQQANQAQFEQRRADTLADIFRTQQGAQLQQGQLDLQRKQFDSSEERDRLKRALVSQILGNAQNLDVSVPGVPKASISGGLGASSLGGDGRAIAQMIRQRAISQLGQPTNWQGGQILNAPNLPAVPKQGGGGLLNALGLVGSVLGGLGGGGGSAAQGSIPGLTLPDRLR